MPGGVLQVASPQGDPQHDDKESLTHPCLGNGAEGGTCTDASPSLGNRAQEGRRIAKAIPFMARAAPKTRPEAMSLNARLLAFYGKARDVATTTPAKPGDYLGNVRSWIMDTGSGYDLVSKSEI